MNCIFITTNSSTFLLQKFLNKNTVFCQEAHQKLGLDLYVTEKNSF